jgi:lycopene cyclase domain-containing protein
MTPETYLGFELALVVPPLLLLAALSRVHPTATRGRRYAIGVVVIVALAVVYTTPWDNLLIERGAWAYGEGVTTRHLWAAPIGEYLFFILQPILVALWLSLFDVPTDSDLSIPARSRLIGGLAGGTIFAIGVGLIALGTSTLYLGAILAWAGPVLAIQWAFGWPHLLRARRTVTIGVGVPTLYLWLIDRYAIERGLWIISEAHTIGISPAGLPVEEMVFFLATNVFIVQGLVLYLWLLDRWPSVAPDIAAALPPALGAALRDRYSSITTTDVE